MMQTHELELTTATFNGRDWAQRVTPPHRSAALQKSVFDRICVASHHQESDVSFCFYIPIWGHQNQPTLVFVDDACFETRLKPNADWMSAAQSSKVLTVSVVTLIMKEINDRLIKAEFAKLDLELSFLNVYKMGPDGISAVARITAAARDKLASWTLFVDTASKYLSEHFPESRALEGLPSAFGRQSVSTRASVRRSDNEASERGLSLRGTLRKWW